MKDIMILKAVKGLIRSIGPVKTVITRDRGTGQYILSVMKEYQGGHGLGYMGAKTVLEVYFEKIEWAERLQYKISELNN